MKVLVQGGCAPGGEAELSGGSWGQRQGSVQYGWNDGTWGAYVGARALEQDGVVRAPVARLS